MVIVQVVKRPVTTVLLSSFMQSTRQDTIVHLFEGKISALLRKVEEHRHGAQRLRRGSDQPVPHNSVPGMTRSALDQGTRQRGPRAAAAATRLETAATSSSRTCDTRRRRSRYRSRRMMNELPAAHGDTTRPRPRGPTDGKEHTARRSAQHGHAARRATMPTVALYTQGERQRE